MQPHEATQNAARAVPGYLRSTHANGVSAHYFRAPVTLNDAARFSRAVRPVAASDRAVCVSGAFTNVVLSVHTRCEIVSSERCPRSDAEGATGAREVTDQPSRGTKRVRDGDPESAPVGRRTGWSFQLPWRRPANRATKSTVAPSALATNAIAGAKSAADEFEPRVVVEEETWRATEYCVAALDRLCSTDGVRVVQQLAVSINHQSSDLRLFSQCPKVIVLARVAAGLATPLVDVLGAVPATFRMDGLLSTSSPLAADPIGMVLSARPTEEEVTAIGHGQPPLCVVVGIASACLPIVARATAQ